MGSLGFLAFRGLQDDAPMQDRPLSALQWTRRRPLSGEHEYDIFLQNHAQIKVYGPSLAMTDNWESHITPLGLTKSVHEYAVYQLLSTADGQLGEIFSQNLSPIPKCC